MLVLVTCKNEETPIKNEGTRVVTMLSIDFSDALGQLTPKSVMESCQNSNMVGLVTCKNKEDPFKSGHNFSPTISLWVFFSDAQGQRTHKSLVGSRRILNPFKMLWLFSLPAKIKKIQLKMKELEWSQGFPYYNPMELSVAMETRVLIRSGPKPYAANPPRQ